MQTLMAGVQYGDWEGTAAADNAEQRDLREFLRENNLAADDEFVVAATLWIGENHPGRPTSPFISALLKGNSSNFDDVSRQVSEGGALSLRKVDCELTLEQFIGFFKRFNIVLTWNGLSLTGREYREV